MTEKTMTFDEGVASLLTPAKAPEAPVEDKKAPPAAEDDPKPAAGSEGEGADEGDDGAEDAAPDADPEGGGDDQPGDEAEPEYDVDLNGEPRKVKFKELVDGWRRGQHYEDKVARLREKETAVERTLGEASQKRAEYDQQLAALSQLLSQEDPDLQQLKQTDPARYLLMKETRREALEKVQAERQKVAVEQRRHMESAMRQHVETERAKLMAQLPSWRDAKTAAAEQQAITQYAKSLGFNDQELQGLTDSRAVIALRKAWLYDKARDLKGQKKPAPSKTVPAGKPATKAETTGRERDRAFERLKRENSIEAGVAALLARR